MFSRDRRLVDVLAIHLCLRLVDDLLLDWMFMTAVVCVNVYGAERNSGEKKSDARKLLLLCQEKNTPPKIFSGVCGITCA